MYMFVLSCTGTMDRESGTGPVIPPYCHIPQCELSDLAGGGSHVIRFFKINYQMVNTVDLIFYQIFVI